MAKNNCERCQGMTREQLCNELGYYRVAIASINKRTYSKFETEEFWRNANKALDLLQECLDSDNS